MNPTDLETRILSLLDGELPSGEARELEKRLLESGEAQQTYRELVLLHNALESRFAVVPMLQQSSMVPMDKLIAAQQRRVVKGSLLAAAAILVLCGVAMWMILAPQRPVEVGVLNTTSGSMVALTYEGEGEAPERGQFVEGSRVRLVKGAMEGSFENGVRFVAQAPCNLLVLSQSKVKLDEGAVWFQVAAGAVGFTVDTPELKAVDLGTEFGVVSSLAGPDEIHVIKGKVEVTPLRGDGGKQTLTAGSALQVGGDGGLEKIVPDASLFQTELLQTREIFIANHSFEQDVIPRDGDRTTKDTGGDDYDKDMVPSGWSRFDDGEGNKKLAAGIISTASDSFFSQVLAPTPDPDANDQTFYSAERDIFQVLGENLQPNSVYVLSADIGDWLAEQGYGGEPGNPGLRLGTATQPGENLLTPKETDFPEQIDGQWVRWSVTYETGPSPEREGQPLRIELTSGARMGWFDDVRLTLTPRSSASR